MARREYSEKFRRDAVKQVIQNGYEIIETAERLGVIMIKNKLKNSAIFLVKKGFYIIFYILKKLYNLDTKWLYISKVGKKVYIQFDLNVPSQMGKTELEEVFADIQIILEKYKDTNVFEIIMESWLLIHQHNKKFIKIPINIEELCYIEYKIKQKNKKFFLLPFLFLIYDVKNKEINYEGIITLKYK
jgi:hypothetical protein